MSVVETLAAFAAEWLVSPAASPFAALTASFLAGLAVALSPSSLPVIPVIAGYVLGSKVEGGIPRLAAFLAGLVSAGIILGLAFALASWLIGTWLGPAWNGVIGVALAVMGLRLLGLLRFRTPALRTEPRRVSTLGGAFLFGMPFVFAL